jgi:hypothetical protein
LSRLSIQGLTGFVVFVAGIFALHATTTPVSTAGDSVNTLVVSEPPAIEGLDPSVVRVLQLDGSAQVFTNEEMADISPVVVRILVEHGVALTVESGGGSR